MANNSDPNKYSKNKDIKPESALSNLAAVGSISLMLIGLIGIGMEMFRDGGWVKTLFGKISQSTTTMISIPAIILVLWIFNRRVSAPSKSETIKSGDLPMYIMMAIGAYYLFKLISTGSF